MAKKRKVSPPRKKRGPRRKAGGLPGRPRTEFNLDDVEKLAALGVSSPQIAAWFGVNESTVKRRKHSDADFAAAIARGAANAQANLQAAQYDTAVVKRNPTMLIWLGQQMLGQRNYKAIEHSGPGGGPIQTQSVDDARAKLAAMLERKKGSNEAGGGSSPAQ